MTTINASLVLLGEPRSLQAGELDPVISPYTDTPLRRIGLTLVAQGDNEHERLNAELEAARSGKDPIDDVDGCRWKVVTNNYSYQSGQSPTRYVHNVELEMQEELSIERVEFDGISVAPDRWSLESNPGDAVVLTMLVSMEPDQNEQFEAVLERHRGSDQQNYFPVKWIGIKDTAVSMRFGRCLWQSLEDSRFRHFIVLVSEDGDDTSIRRFNEPEMSRLEEQSVIATAKLDALIHELQQAGTLNADAVARINDVARALRPADRRVFDRADDVDSFFD